MAKTFAELHMKHEDLFSITSINGFCLQSSSKISENSKVDLDIGFHPTELVTIMTQNGPQLAYAHHLRNFQISGSTKYSIFDISALISSYFQVFSFSAKPHNAISCSAKFFKRPNSKFIPTISSQFRLQKMAITSQMQTIDYRTPNSIDMTFSLFDQFAFQVVRRKNMPLGYAFLTSYDFSKSSIALSLSIDKDLSTLMLRNKTKINENTRAGVKYQIDQKMNSNLALAYKAKIKDSIVHGMVDTGGIVQSYFDYKMNDLFHFIMTSTLDHNDRNYRFGIGLSWAPPETNK
ncbi:hypothetical protein TRFO_09795 [Tritrichomonas foetus]|uniref:Uncharacterized protein n=1 Tax=Tritrichomonas foetus TaxID=1144522 RepID=A0A1J4JDB9_9EUKA|nr:hypothetical protein TRFO_09795 [Tritrichomonas foetus]|eukprot:OHS96649.1 hypothetical protein TRFO_09795 [Tritrichomonas foetus]